MTNEDIKKEVLKLLDNGLAPWEQEDLLRDVAISLFGKKFVDEYEEAMYVYNIFDDKLVCFFQGRLDWSSDYMPKYGFNAPNGETILISNARENYHPISVVILSKDYKCDYIQDSERFTADDTRKILLDNARGIIMQNTDEGTVSAKIQGLDKTDEIYQTEINGFVYVYFEDGKQNIVDIAHNDYVFGMNCIDTGPSAMRWQDDDTVYDENKGFVGKFIVRGHTTRFKYIWYYIKSGKYETADKRDGQREECDRYGKTLAQREKERLSDRNMEKYWKGYSPETQAQMDKMWADRAGSEYDGSKALNAWNDYDRYLDKAATDGNKYFGDFDWCKRLQQFDDDENWRGFIGQKDPEGMRQQIDRAIGDGPDAVSINDFIAGKVPDYVRKNPWYRVDRMGRPMEQPWYDEDEVPARFSDESLNEGVKKIKDLMNRIMKD